MVTTVQALALCLLFLGLGTLVGIAIESREYRKLKRKDWIELGAMISLITAICALSYLGYL